MEFGCLFKINFLVFLQGDSGNSRKLSEANDSFLLLLAS